MSARRFLPVLALAALLFAGCSGPQAAPETSAGQSQSASPAGAAAGGAAIANATALPPPADLAFTGCLQLHTFFPFPTAVLAQIGFEMPDGFSFASEDGATVKVFLAWWACPEGHLTDGINAPFAPVGSMFASLPVLPPADLAARDPNATAPQLDLFPLVWIVSNQVAANHLAGIAGLDDGYVETGDVLRTTDLQGPTQVEGMQAHASFGTFDADAAFQPAPGDNPAGRYRMWLVPGDGAITQYVDIANGAGRTLGSGYADLRFQGDPGAGAPPATGGLSHVADGTDVLVRVVDLSKP